MARRISSTRSAAHFGGWTGVTQPSPMVTIGSRSTPDFEGFCPVDFVEVFSGFWNAIPGKPGKELNFWEGALGW
jgi:hypothetical protein